MTSSSNFPPVVILCGGKGTRIRGVDDTVPKPMIPVGNQPMVVHIMEHYAHFGYHNFVLCLGYLGNVVRSHFGAAKESATEQVQFTLPNNTSVMISLVDTGQDTMTGGRVRKIRDLVGDHDFLLTYGDGVSDVPIDEVVTFHNKHDAAMTLTAVRPPSRFGEVTVDALRGEGLGQCHGERDHRPGPDLVDGRCRDPAAEVPPQETLGPLLTELVER